MNIYQRKKSPSRWGAWMGVGLLFLIAILLLLFGAVGLISEQTEAIDPLGIVFLVVGLVPMLVSVRGAWYLVKFQKPYFLQITAEQISYGLAGQEQSYAWEQVEQIYWHEGKRKTEFAFALLLKDKQVVKMIEADLLVPLSERKELKNFLQGLRPEIAWSSS